MREMPSVKYEINFRDYYHEKAQESRHKETQACLMFVAGAVFFVGGILENLSLAKNPEWFIFIPYHTIPLPGAVLGLSLIVSGLSLMVLGIVSVFTYYSHRRLYMEELRKTTSKDELELFRKRQIEKTNRKTRH
jgi:Ca2+/H+ antiporter